MTGNTMSPRLTRRVHQQLSKFEEITLWKKVGCCWVILDFSLENGHRTVEARFIKANELPEGAKRIVNLCLLVVLAKTTWVEMTWDELVRRLWAGVLH